MTADEEHRQFMDQIFLRDPVAVSPSPNRRHPTLSMLQEGSPANEEDGQEASPSNEERRQETGPSNEQDRQDTSPADPEAASMAECPLFQHI